ncbi:anti-sigma factor [Streptomyces sp. NPDC058655]|uniref:anti-sigma factor n=1 Tax=Streptomyces sp. NPDC058655 TaxID=3346577 RepID=UPI0036633B09
MSTTPEPHAPLGAYLLHALPPDEESAFEEHLAGCADCRRELAALVPVLVRLCATEAAAPAPELRARVLEQIALTPQEPRGAAVSTGEAAARPVPEAVAPPHALPKPAGPRARARAAGGTPHPPPGRGAPAKRPPGRAGLRSPLHWALAASLAAAAAFGGIAVWQHQEAERARTELHRAGPAVQLADVLAAPDAAIGTADLGDGATGSVIVSRAERRGAFMASGLPQLTSDQVYELWYDDSGRARSAGTLTGRGNWHIKLLDGDVDRATALGITVEPAGGSAKPTGPPVGLIDIPV